MNKPFRESDRLSLKIAAMPIPRDLDTNSTKAYKRALEDVLIVVERNTRGSFAGLETPEEIFAQYVRAASSTIPDENGFILHYGLTPFLLEGKIEGWNRDYAKNRLETEVDEGRLIRTQILECDEGHKNADKKMIQVHRDGNGYCTQCDEDVEFSDVYIGPGR